MGEIRSIVIIGSGNVATCFGEAFHQAGLTVQAVYSPNSLHAQVLADQLKSKAVSEWKHLPTDADMYLLAVKDSVIKEVSDALEVRGIVVHCSGITSVDVLNVHQNYGVLWPLQTISKKFLPNFKTIPLCVEANDPLVSEEIFKLATTISAQVVWMNSTQRKYAHLAAVIANNFSNHLFNISAQILQSHDLAFELLRPIIQETARKVQQSNPDELQTGPAKRNDTETIRQHLEMLKDQPEFRRIYELMSHNIMNQSEQSEK